jgi:hypothetical protein
LDTAYPAGQSLFDKRTLNQASNSTESKVHLRF